MASRTITSKEAPAAIGPYSHAKGGAGLIFVSGQLGLDPATGNLVHGGIQAQTHQALRNLNEILRSAGLGFEDVLKTTVFLANIGDFAAFNEVYATCFPDDPPARSAFQVAALPKGGSVEIEAIAADSSGNNS